MRNNHGGTEIPGYFVLGLLLLLCRSLGAATKPNILLITIDTLRADHLKCYGYKENTSPNLDRFAEEGILFQNAYATVPLTLPSHATMLSGLYPKGHGIRDNAHFPLTKSPLVQQILKQSGYHTAAFISGTPLASSFGLNRGFGYYDDEFPGTERKANETTERVLRWLKEAKAPYFLWVHYFDPHAEYEPPEAFRKKFPASPYDGEIGFVDSEIAKLLNAVGGGTYVIVTADHGESLGEHGENTHSVFLYNATLRVPLLIRGPEIKTGVRNDPVSLADIAPTILELSRVSAQMSGLDGVSLFAKIQERNLLAESLFAQRNFGYAALYACIRQEGKYIHAPQSEFYDLQTDPAEQRNLIKEKKVTDWQAVLKTYAQGESRRTAEPSVSPEEQEKLRSLGYVSTSVTGTGADPKSKIQVIEQFRQAMILLKKERFDQAERSFREITATERHNGLGFRFLADALSAQEKYAEAAKAYSASLERLPDPYVAVQLAKAYNRLKQPSEAEATLRSAIKRFPDYSEAVFELSAFYASQARWEEAFGLLQLDNPEFQNQRGILYLEKKEPQKAKDEFLLALRSQQKAFYWNNLGIASQRLRQLREAEDAFQQALKLNPDYEECQANLAFLFVDQKRWEEAKTLLQGITLKNSELWRARFALGFVLENQGRAEEALAVYRELLADAPDGWPERGQLEARVRELAP